MMLAWINKVAFLAASVGLVRCYDMLSAKQSANTGPGLVPGHLLSSGDVTPKNEFNTLRSV